METNLVQVSEPPQMEQKPRRLWGGVKTKINAGDESELGRESDGKEEKGWRALIIYYKSPT